MIVYVNNQYTENQKLSLDLNDRGFLFGDGIYEALVGKNKKVFALDAHIKRLQRSAELIRLSHSVDSDSIQTIINHLIDKNQIGNKPFFVYLQLTRGCAERNHLFPPSSIPPTFYLYVKEFSVNPNNKKGISVFTVEDTRWKNCHIKSINLLPNVLARQEAEDNHCQEALFNHDGVITEGSHTNFFAVKNGQVFTHPLCHKILSGVTRNIVIELCQNNAIPVVEKAIKADELCDYSEFFMTGTTTLVAPVISINHKINQPIGRVTTKIIELFNKKMDQECR